MTLDEETIAELERGFAVFARQHRAASGRLGRDAHPDLKVTAYGLLAHLAENGPRRPMELACETGVTAPSISRQLHHLRNLGLVERLQVPDDGRGFLVCVTEKGRLRAAEVQSARVRRLCKALESWPENDVRTFAELLARFNDGAAEPAAGCGGAGGGQPGRS